MYFALTNFEVSNCNWEIPEEKMFEIDHEANTGNNLPQQCLKPKPIVIDLVDDSDDGQDEFKDEKTQIDSENDEDFVCPFETCEYKFSSQRVLQLHISLLHETLKIKQELEYPENVDQPKIKELAEELPLTNLENIVGKTDILSPILNNVLVKPNDIAEIVKSTETLDLASLSKTNIDQEGLANLYKSIEKEIFHICHICDKEFKQYELELHFLSCNLEDTKKDKIQNSWDSTPNSVSLPKTSTDQEFIAKLDESSETLDTTSIPMTSTEKDILPANEPKCLKNHKCESCGKSFFKAQNLKIHIGHAHKGHKNHKCESCGKSFFKAGSLKIHI